MSPGAAGVYAGCMTRRLWALCVVLSLVALGAWAAAPAEVSGDGPGGARGSALAAATAGIDPVVTTTTTVPPTTTVATTTTTAPPDPWTTLVATIHPDVPVLETFDAPDGDPVTFEFAVTNPTFFGNPLVLMVTDRTDDGAWLKVQVPVRPNGTEAWIRAADAEVSSHRYHAEIDVTARTVRVWNGDELLVETAAVVGTERTPTPLGRFFVNDLVPKAPTGAYGPYVLSLSGFSEALESFDGGLPVIAIHGTNRPDLLGQARSNGCIRIPNEVIEVLAGTVPMGTPVDIVG